MMEAEIEDGAERQAVEVRGEEEEGDIRYG